MTKPEEINMTQNPYTGSRELHKDQTKNNQQPNGRCVVTDIQLLLCNVNSDNHNEADKNFKNAR